MEKTNKNFHKLPASAPRLDLGLFQLLSRSPPCACSGTSLTPDLTGVSS